MLKWWLEWMGEGGQSLAEGVTGASDVFVPQVVGDLATDILFQKVPLLRSGYVRDGGSMIWEEGGKTVTFPYWNTSKTGIVQDNPGATRSGVNAHKATMDSYTEPLLSKIVSMDMDKNVLTDITKKANLNQHMADLVGSESALDIQRSLVLSGEETDLALSILTASTKTLNVDAILEAKMKRGEHAQDGDPILFVHSKQLTDLGKSSDYKTLGSAATTALVQAGLRIPPTVEGRVHGCWVATMDTVRNQASIPAISSITRSSAVATVTTASAHELRVGDEVEISGATETEYNGVHTVVTVPTATTFTYAVAGSPSSPATGSPVFTPNYTGLMVWPGALAFYPKKDVAGTVKDVHAGTTVVTIDWDFRYATTLVRNKPRGVVKLRTR